MPISSNSPVIRLQSPYLEPNGSAYRASSLHSLEVAPQSMHSTTYRSSDFMAPTIVTSIDELYDLLDDAMEECPTGAHGRFLPMSALDDLITRDNVGAVLWPGGKLTDRDRQALDTVVQKCRKVFALLTIIGRHKAIQDLISEGMSDEHLPLSRPPGPKSNILYSAMSKAEFRTFSTQKKARYFVDEIILKQWWFMAPILDSHRKVWLGPQSIVEPGGKIHQKCPLPFLKSKDIRNTPGTVVYKVKLHRAHLRGFPVSGSARIG